MNYHQDFTDTNALNDRLKRSSDSIIWGIDQQFRNQLCAMVDRKMNEIYKRRQDPEDIVQSVFRSFFVRASNGEFKFENRQTLWHLLQRIARNKMLKRIQKDRARKRDVAREQNDVADSILFREPNDAQAHVLADALESALNGLSSPAPEFCKLQLFGYSVSEVVEIILRDLESPYPEILMMKLQGASESEIAKSLGCLRGKVRYQLNRLQTRLASLLGNHEKLFDE